MHGLTNPDMVLIGQADANIGEELEVISCYFLSTLSWLTLLAFIFQYLSK